MKTNNVIIGVFCFGLGFTACSTDDFESKALVGSDNVSAVSIGIKDFVLDPYATTRTDFKFDASGFSFEWSEKDTLGIYPEKGDQTYFAIPDEAVGKSYATFDGGGWLLRNGRTYYGYYPFSRKNYQAEEFKNQIQVSYEGQSQTGNNSTLGLGKYDFMATRATSADVGKVDFMFEHLGAIAMIKVNAPVEGTFTKLRIAADENDAFVRGASYDVMSATPSDIPALDIDRYWDGRNYMELGLNEITAIMGQELTFYMMIPPSESISKLYLTLFTNDSEVYTHDITFGKQFKPGYAYLLDFREALGNDYEQVSAASEDTFVDNGYSTVWTVHTTNSNYAEKLETVRMALVNMADNGDSRMITLKMPDITLIPDYAFSKDREGNKGSGGSNLISNLYAFEGKDVQTVEKNAFWGIKSLSRISLPNATLVTGFSETNLTSISLPKAKEIGGAGDYDDAFVGCPLTSIDLPEAEIIWANAFRYCQELTSVYLPKAKTIGPYAFYQSAIKSVNLPEVTSLGGFVFQYTPVESVCMPKVTSLTGDFRACTELKTISLPSLEEGNEGAFMECTSLENVDFPNLVTVGPNMFSGCTSLTEITLPEATSIGHYSFSGYYSVPACINLSSISAPKATLIDVAAFSGTNLSTVDLPLAEEVRAHAFGSGSLRTISLPSCTKIGYHALSCAYLNTVSLPSLYYAEEKVFEGDLELETIHLGDYSSNLHEGNNQISTSIFDGAVVSGCSIFLPSDPDLRGYLDVSGFAHVYVGGVQVR